MTPQLKAAIAAIQLLSPAERQQLLQILTEEDVPATLQADLKHLSDRFWQGTTIEQLRATQTPTTARNLEELAADFWPPEESIEDFLTFLKQQRQEAI